MTAAPGPQQPDEVERYTPEPFVPEWADEHVLGLIDRNRRALALVRASTGELATRVELILSGADYPVAPSAQPGYEREPGPPVGASGGPHNPVIAPSGQRAYPEPGWLLPPAQPVRDTEEGRR